MLEKNLLMVKDQLLCICPPNVLKVVNTQETLVYSLLTCQHMNA